jgi:hypothetical protein
MEVKRKAAVPGHTYRVRRSYRCRLPAGLPDGAVLTALSCAGGAIRMRDGTDREWLVSALCVDTGHLYNVDGSWLEASDPRVESHLVRRQSRSSGGKAHPLADWLVR